VVAAAAPDARSPCRAYAGCTQGAARYYFNSGRARSDRVNRGEPLKALMGVTRLADLPAEWSRQHQMLGLQRSPSRCRCRSLTGSSVPNRKRPYKPLMDEVRGNRSAGQRHSLAVGRFALNREISVCAGLRGGGRSRYRTGLTGPNSLLTGKITGNFDNFGPVGEVPGKICEANQGVANKFPSQRNREFL
jgi:hypothetical protein